MNKQVLIARKIMSSLHVATNAKEAEGIVRRYSLGDDSEMFDGLLDILEKIGKAVHKDDIGSSDKHWWNLFEKLYDPDEAEDFIVSEIVGGNLSIIARSVEKYHEVIDKINDILIKARKLNPQKNTKDDFEDALDELQRIDAKYPNFEKLINKAVNACKEIVENSEGCLDKLENYKEFKGIAKNKKLQNYMKELNKRIIG